MVRVLACGGRDYTDTATVYRTLRELRATVVIHGAARGADSFASRWAEQNGIEQESYPANWQRDGKAAGHIRNAEMLAKGKPDIVVAFSGGRGTADMVAKARKAGVQVALVSDDGQIAGVSTPFDNSAVGLRGKS
ncbi:MAG: DUF2493 domain-containing protein [Pseudomonadota bacterium]